MKNIFQLLGIVTLFLVWWPLGVVALVFVLCGQI
jgi:hypothetical protein